MYHVRVVPAQTIPEIDCSSSRLWPVGVAQAHMATQRNATTPNSLYQVARGSGVSLVAPPAGGPGRGRDSLPWLVLVSAGCNAEREKKNAMTRHGVRPTKVELRAPEQHTECPHIRYTRSALCISLGAITEPPASPIIRQSGGAINSPLEKLHQASSGSRHRHPQCLASGSVWVVPGGRNGEGHLLAEERVGARAEDGRKGA